MRESFKKANPKLSDVEINRKVNENVIKDSMYNKILSYLTQFYDIKVDDDDIEQVGLSFQFHSSFRHGLRFGMI